MLDHLVDLYRPFVDRVVVVVAPAAEALVRRHVTARGVPADIRVQDRPTGMLDAVLAPLPLLDHVKPDRVWITWCDQIGVRHETLDRLAAAEQPLPGPAMAMPTCTGTSPYIHFERMGDGRIARVLHRREGDAMPAVGESDIGVFSLSGDTYLRALPAFERQADAGSQTGERNFLPFIPWLAATQAAFTLPCTEAMEAIGVNTPDDLARMSAHLRRRPRPAPGPGASCQEPRS